MSLHLNSFAAESPPLRFGFMAVFQAKGASSPPGVTLVSRIVGTRTPHTAYHYMALDEMNRTFESGFVKVGGQREVSLSGCRTTLCLLKVELPYHGRVRSRTPHAFVASAESPLRLSDTIDATLYFYVPQDCDRFEIGGECGPRRILPLEVYDPNGDAVTAETNRDSRTWFQTWQVDVPEEFRNAVWSMHTRVTADLRVKLEGNLPPLLAMEPEWAEQLGKRIEASTK